MTALSDEFTAASYTRTVRLTRKLGLFLAFLLVYVAVCLWLLFAAPGVGRQVGEGLAGGLLVGAAAMVFVTVPTLPVVTTRPGMRALLAREPWREAPARVLDTTGTTLWLGGEEYVRVKAMPAAAREIVVRAGRVWFVGPDAKGGLVVRVDGLSTLWPACRIPPVEATSAAPTGQPVMDLWLGRATDRRQVVPSVVMVFAGAFELVLALLPGMDTMMGAFGVGFLAYGGARWLWIRRYRRLLPSGSWVRAAATAPVWRARRNGTADGTVALELPDGRRLTARITRAPLDLFTNVAREQALWIAGDTVVGFPHYPILARARLVPSG